MLSEGTTITFGCPSPVKSDVRQIAVNVMKEKIQEANMACDKVG